MPNTASPRVLFIDAYDSFSNNIISLLETNLDVKVTAIKIDEDIENFSSFLRPFTAIVAGPGPGNPKNRLDVGWIDYVWRLKDEDLIPVLGICLGFQSLVLAFGGDIKPLPAPRHGISRRVQFCRSSVFGDIEKIEAVQYHSLHASLGHSQETHDSEYKQLDLIWNTTRLCPELRPLAWDFEVDNSPSTYNESTEKNPALILMAVEHVSKPFAGIQFHPESVCSNHAAQEVLKAWWSRVRSANHDKKSYLQDPRNGAVYLKCHDEDSLASTINESLSNRDLNSKMNTASKLEEVNGTSSTGAQLSLVDRSCLAQQPIPDSHLVIQTISKSQLTVPNVCASLGLSSKALVVLDSELHQRPEIGVNSIIGLIDEDVLKIVYAVGSKKVRVLYGETSRDESLEEYGGSIFCYLKRFMNAHKAHCGSPESPFWGGLVGYITYEACLETIDILEEPARDGRPDLCFAFVERSIVIDHPRQQIHVQSIRPNDGSWVKGTTDILRCAKIKTKAKGSPSCAIPPSAAAISLPQSSVYKENVRSCQDFIHSGDSYELCLTTQATIIMPRYPCPWHLYLSLRSLNPAPFSTYLRLGDLTLLSSSPERFLSWSRPKPSGPGLKTSTCQFRPIKGTVKRVSHPGAEPVSLAEATSILSTPKERAENLMIVDLIRHDLHGVIGSGNVRVGKLMAVEKYATLYQLVTVVEGTLKTLEINGYDNPSICKGAIEPAEVRTEDKGQNQESTAPLPNIFPSNNHASSTYPTGIDILAASLPPGSMTGAPKRRACALLRGLESRPRGVYSGIVGYLDVGGGGDFSVVIRSAFRWDNEHAEESPSGNSVREMETTFGEDGKIAGDANRCSSKGPKDEAKDTWTIGAGGAVTALSTPEGEWEEMLAKLRSTLRLFDDEKS